MDSTQVTVMLHAFEFLPCFEWHRLQPVGFSPCKAQTPQAEACATKSTDQVSRFSFATELKRPLFKLHFAFQYKGDLWNSKSILAQSPSWKPMRSSPTHSTRKSPRKASSRAS